MCLRPMNSMKAQPFPKMQHETIAKDANKSYHALFGAKFQFQTWHDVARPKRILTIKYLQTSYVSKQPTKELIHAIRFFDH